MKLILSAVVIISGLWLCFAIHPALGLLVLSGGLLILINFMKAFREEDRKHRAVVADLNRVLAGKDEPKENKEDPSRFMPPSERKQA